MSSVIPGVKQLWNRYQYSIQTEARLQNKLLSNDLFLSKSYVYLKQRESFLMFSKLKNRCVLTNRARAVFIQVKLTRMAFKNLAVIGYLNGIRKYSW